ncbi:MULTISPECIES: hypothetical protein [Burkholderiaceae]|uniref:hypothetical protein n=1 Tax=Burkholderiaceae TaxID=119060 RepID=UPI001588A602|nr:MULTISPECIES: hypothetical protein [Burkholderiaceae]MCG1018615.1 hypothetical protein [Mycetohabitans sp. B4]
MKKYPSLTPKTLRLYGAGAGPVLFNCLAWPAARPSRAQYHARYAQRFRLTQFDRDVLTG